MSHPLSHPLLSFFLDSWLSLTSLNHFLARLVQYWFSLLISKEMTFDYSSAFNLVESKSDAIFLCRRRSFLSGFTLDVVEVESRKQISEEMMEALCDDNIQVIGVLGVAGVGKTTLVTQVANQGYQNHLFDLIIMLSVSQSLDSGGIQTRIADMLDMKFEQEEVSERAYQLYKRLEHEKGVLIVFDDVLWGIDLVRIGIPSGHEFDDVRFPNVKIIVICREPPVLRQLKAQKNFWIQPLQQDEATSCFLKLSGIPESDNEYYQDLGVEIVNHSEGLPILLFTVAKALRKREFAWENALLQLQAYKSYTRLTGEELRFTFLLCAALGEDIFLEDLLRHCFGLGLAGCFTEIGWARKVMIDRFLTLKKSSLLRDGNPRASAAMNSFVRDWAIKNAFKEHNMFVIPDGVEDRIWADDELDFTAIFLSGNHQCPYLPQRLACPKLELLHIKDGSGALAAIPNNFFEFINRELKVLSLNNIKLPSLPPSIVLLKNIQTLSLDECDLGDIGLLGKLISLKILSLSGTNLEELPNQIRNLVNLWLLDLKNCSKLKTIPPKVISNLTRLQELLLPNSFGGWQYSNARAQGCNDERTNPSLDELAHLNDLEALEIHIPNVNSIPQVLFLHKLKRYKIFIGQEWGQWDTSNYKRNLLLNLGRDIERNDWWLKWLLKKSQGLWLKEFKGFKIHGLAGKVFPKLRHLHIQDTAEIECLIMSVHNPSTESVQNPFIKCLQNPFPNLEWLILINLINFKAFYSQPSKARFGYLRVVKVQRCDMLEFIFSFSNISRHRSKLTEMEISRCDNLGNIVAGNTESKVFEFPELRVLTLQNLPKLNGLVIGEPTQEENLNSCPLFDKISMPKLEKLNLHGLNRFKCVCSDARCMLQMLTSLTVFGCDNLKYLFSLPAAENLSNLQDLRVIACMSIEEIVVRETDTGTDDGIKKILWARVNTLTLEDLPKLHGFSKDGCIVEWQLLKKIRVIKCPKISMFSMGIVDKSNLEVEAGECPWHKEGDPHWSMEYLFFSSDPLATLTILDIKSSDELRSVEMELKPLSLSKVKRLSASNCDERLTEFLSKVLPRLYELELVEVQHCELLMQIFNWQNLVADDNGNGKYFTPLKTIKLRDLPKLSCLCNNLPTSIHFLHNLQEIEIINCGSLKSILPTSLIHQLQQLKVIKVHSCPIVDEVVSKHSGEETRAETVLHGLHHLELVHLPNFTTLGLYKENYLFQYPSLLSLSIEDCPLMDALGSGPVNNEKSGEDGVLVAYQKMQNLKLVSVHNFEALWKGTISPMSFSELKEVEVNNLSKLKYLIPSMVLPLLKNLEKLTVMNCDSLTGVFELDKECDSFSGTIPEPSTFALLKLKHIIKFDLQILQVKSCDNLQRLALPSICLSKLKLLEISECKILEQIFLAESEEVHVQGILFSHLESIFLDELPKLSSFCWETLEFPSLVEARIIDCPKLNSFPSLIQVPERFPASANYFFTNQGSFENLQKLHLINLGYCQNTLNEELSPDSQSELKVMVPSSLLRWMPKLEEITVKECKSLKVAFEIEEDYPSDLAKDGLLPQLKEMMLIDLPDIELWNQEPKIPVFKNLKWLEIVGCSSLKKLFSISTARNLENLEFLKIYECPMMEQVLEGESGSRKTLEFPNLGCLILKHLPNLTCFCGQDCHINLPALEMFRVKNIPRMEMFSKETSTPILKEVYVSYVTKCWKGDLNNTIEYLHDHPDTLLRVTAAVVEEGHYGDEQVGHGQEMDDEQGKKLSNVYSRGAGSRESHCGELWPHVSFPEGDGSVVVPASFLEQEESSEGAARENEELITEVPEEAVVLADSDSKTSWIGEEIGVRDINDDKGQLVKIFVDDHVVEKILVACQKRPGFLPPRSDLLRRELLQHPVLAGPFRERSSRLAVVSYEVLADVLLVLEGRNLSQMSDAECNALLLQLEELKMLGFDQSWVDSLRQCFTKFQR